MSDSSNGSHEFRLQGAPTQVVDATKVDRPRAVAAATERSRQLGAS